MHANQDNASSGEYLVPNDQVIISRTDLKGRITYANDAFLDAAGYRLDEVMGKAHSVVRDAGMPRAAFCDLWDTLKAGKAWTGVVKNRRSCGGHYWVRAYVTPVMVDGECTGYMSVRVQASRDEITAAQALYEQLDKGTAMTPAQAREAAAKAPFELREGTAVPRALLARTMHRVMSWSVDLRLALCCAALTVMALGAAAVHTYNGPTAVMWGLLFLLCAGPWVGFGYLKWRVLNPVERLRQTATRVLKGDTLARFEESGDEATRVLASALNQMAMRSAGFLRDVQDRVVQLTDIGERMQQSSEALSASTEQQAASLATVAQSVQDIASGVQQTAAQTQDVDKLSEGAVQMAQSGGVASNEVAQAVKGIGQATGNVSALLDKIREIAMQTNILAINATIEAAHAQAAGAGFSVIAKEVRALSGKVSDTVNEVETLNAAVGKELQSAADTVQRLAESVRQIEGSCAEVGGLVGQVAQTTRTQSSALGEVSTALTELDTATQYNAQVAAGTAGTSSEVRSHAQRLRDALGLPA